MGVKVVLNRMTSDGVTPSVRIFNAATYWEYVGGGNKKNNLNVVNKGEEYTLLAEFAADAVESVEFV